MTHGRGSARALVIAALSALVATAAASAPAQGAASDSVARFVARARAGTERYRDRAAAIADGYRLIGPDFPGMGEHWIQLALLFSARFDVAHPPVLEYAVIGGRPTLVGVAYALPLLPGESPPDFPSPHAWHDHTATVDEESAVIEQVSSTHTSAGARIAMLHAWIWSHNPAGTFTSNNWTLPFRRSGLAFPDGVAPGPSAARALALATGGDAFAVQQLIALGHPDATDSARIASAVARARDRAEAWLVGHRHGALLEPSDLDALASIWRALWRDLDGVRPEVRGRLAGLR